MTQSIEFRLEPTDNQRLANLCGQFDEHLKQVEARLGVEVQNRGDCFRVSGDAKAVAAASTVLRDLYRATDESALSPERVHLYLQESGIDQLLDAADTTDKTSERVNIVLKRQRVECRGGHQTAYVNSIRARDLTFGIGPAGTGKTYLAVACAVEALESDLVRRLVLVRPAVEAGERLGFLPGDLAQKVDPYLRPIYDALYEFMGFERVAKLIERNVIEVAPLAYMRGRTLNHSAVIMDEAQNTTVEQMKMFLTRIGFGSHAIVTGDVTQIDLPKHTTSGLVHVTRVLSDIDDIGFVHFDARDVVRHPLVKRIVSAYHKAEQADAKKQVGD
ncbi:MAG: PhoH family protein [Pseudomonadota bacterium]